MLKHLSARVVAAAVIFLIALQGISWVSADDSSAWVNSPLSLLKQSETTSTPPTLGNFGNIDCAMEQLSGCSVATAYGSGTSNSSVRLNDSDTLLPVTTFVDNRQHFFPVTNSDTAISYFSGPPYGLDLAFNYNFSSSVKKVNGGLQITKAPDAKLMDSSRHLLAADIASISYSENGLWMVVSDPNVAMLRVNLQTFEVLPFGTSYNYTIGLDPALKTAITNDGRYALAASKNLTAFKIYDLSTCGSTPSTISGPVACQSRDLNSFMQQALPGFDSVLSARFMNDNNLAIYAVYKSGGVNKTARFILNDGSGTAQLDYLALGDSYIAGEGAYDYMPGTDTAENKCHLSFLSYPFLIGHDLNYNSYHSVACSGAVTNDLTDTSIGYRGQANHGQSSRTQLDQAGLTSQYLNSFMPGYIDQLDFVKNYQPKAITVSIGGNDMGFSDILKICVAPWDLQTCYSTYEDRLELVREINTTVFPRLINTYQKLKSAGPPNMQVYVVGYPQIAKPGGDCALNVHLNSDEILFSQQLIGYIDSVIKIAADKTGVYYVDTQSALDGHRLCEAQPGSVAMNGLTAGNDRPSAMGGPLADESYHPNDFGYQLLENKILSDTHNLTVSMPPLNSAASLQPENSLELLNVPHSNRAINTAEFDPGISEDLAYEGLPFSVSIDGVSHNLAPLTSLKAELHSTPVALGTFTTDSRGNLTILITVPEGIAYGYHTLHFYGTDLNGQSVDIYKTIYIGKTADDIDGNGIDDSTQACVGIPSPSVDSDKDGIDDACDANITAPPQSPGGSIVINTTNIAPTDSFSDSTVESSVSTAQTNTSAGSGIVLAATESAPAGYLPVGIDASKILKSNEISTTQPSSIKPLGNVTPFNGQTEIKNESLVLILALAVSISLLMFMKFNY